ncbi:major facilitator superfamily domain-containing protein [Multifurca ochricompacta]|uniref:Major facilitator superfamily domain-containing protein n=1 Tax=Multifurca ochricompacta TaxID=376703 RepID=A0AAD4LZ81_9AGAM|nr:major facilitator superfamily domain-containing protein [Multifurca ochricompacta]
MASPSASLSPSRSSSPTDEEFAVKSATERDKARFKECGSNDPQDPPPNAVTKPARSLPFLPKPNTDPNLVTWDGPNDPANPQNWSSLYKWWLTIVCTVMTLNVTFASSAPSSASPFIAHDFKVGREVGDLILTLYLIGYMLGPTFWGPGSELIGRRPIFIGTLAIYTIFHIGQARANNMTTLLVTRFLCGFFAVAPLTNSTGVIADIWDPMIRGIATSIFASAVFLGPVLGPVVGSFVTTSYLGWRWTYAPVLLAQKAKRLRKADPVKNKELYAESENVSWAVGAVLERTIFRPFKMLLVEPILLLSTIYLSVAYGVIYAMFQALPVVFIRTRHFSISNDGLVFIGIGIGSVLATLWYGFPPVEERLYSAMLGGPILVIGILWLGWTGNYESVPWWIPALSTILIGLAITLVFISFIAIDLSGRYVPDVCGIRACRPYDIRSATGAAFPLFTTQMFVNLGTNWAATLLGGIALLLAPMPFLFYKYGPRIRSKSSFAPCIDLKVAKFLEEEARSEKGQQTV